MHHSSRTLTESNVPLNFRVRPTMRNLTDRTAELIGKTRTEFMLEAYKRLPKRCY